MTSFAPHQHIELWLDLQRAVDELRQVTLWGFEAARMQYWSGADLHPVPTLVLCCRGQQRVETAQGSERCDLQQAEALLLAPGVCHQHPQPRGAYSSLQLGFRGGVCDYWLMNRELLFVGRVPLQPYRRSMDELLEVTAARRLSLLRELLQQFLHEPRHQQQHFPPALDAMLQYLQYHAHQPITAGDIVQASGLKHARAYAIFHDYHGAAPKQVLQQRRIEIARAHLRAGASLSEAAQRSGFGSRRKMQRAFERYAGAPAQLPSGRK